MTTNTTTTLRIAPIDRALMWLRWHRQNIIYALVALAWLITLVLVSRTLSGPPSARTAAQPTAPLSIIIIATPRPVPPTSVPAPTATPDTRVLEELAALRAQVDALQSAAAQPVYVDRTVYVSQPAEAAPTIAPEQYSVASVPPAPTMAPQQLVILDRGAWAAQAQQHNAP